MRFKTILEERENLSSVGFVMMGESCENDCTLFNYKKENKTSYLNSFGITQIISKIFKIFFNHYSIKFSKPSYLFLNSFEQDRVFMFKFLQDFFNLRSIYIHNSSHHLLNSLAVIALPRGSFSAFFNSLINSSLKGSQSTNL